LVLYDISGKLVRTIHSGVQEKGEYEVNVGATLAVAQNNGQSRQVRMPLPAGIYFIRLEAGDFKATSKLTILK